MDELNIAVEGDASGAITAFDGLGDSVDSFNVRMGSLSESFSRPLEHVGVHIFGQELMTTFGIAGEGRVIFPLLSAAVTESAEAFGIGAGAASLYTFGLAAIAAIAFKVYEAHKDQAASTEAVNSTNQKVIQSSASMVESLESYRTTAGRLTPELQNIYDIEKKLVDLKNSEEISAYQKVVDANEKQISNLLTLQNTYKGINIITLEHSAYTAADAAEVEKLKAVDADLEAQIKSLKSGHGGLNAEVSKGTQVLNDNVKAQTQMWTEVLKSTAADEAQAQAIAKLNSSFVNWSDATIAKTRDMEQAAMPLKDQNESIALTYEKMRDESDKYFASEFKKLDEDKAKGIDVSAALVQARTLQASRNAAIADQEAAAEQRATAQWFGVTKSYYTEATSIAASAFQSTANSAGTAFSKMIFEGQNFSVSMQQAFKNMAEQFVSQVSQMMIKWAAFQAMTGILSGGAGLAGGDITSLSGGAFGGGSLDLGGGATPFGGSLTGGAPIANAGQFAEGFMGRVSSPTAFIAGEKGDEDVLILPAGADSSMKPGAGLGGGGSSGSQSITVTFGDIVIQGIQDPRQFADQIALLVTQAIRGRGQLSAVGPGIF